MDVYIWVVYMPSWWRLHEIRNLKQLALFGQKAFVFLLCGGILAAHDFKRPFDGWASVGGLLSEFCLDADSAHVHLPPKLTQNVEMRFL